MTALEKIRSCFFKAEELKMLNYVSASAADQHSIPENFLTE